MREIPPLPEHLDELLAFFADAARVQSQIEALRALHTEVSQKLATYGTVEEIERLSADTVAARRQAAELVTAAQATAARLTAEADRLRMEAMGTLDRDRTALEERQEAVRRMQYEAENAQREAAQVSAVARAALAAADRRVSEAMLAREAAERRADAAEARVAALKAALGA